MQDFVLARAEGGSPREMAAACARELGAAAGVHRLGFVYATSPLAPAFATVVAELRARTGIESWIGTVGHGVCATGADYFDTPAVVAMACAIAPSDYRLVAATEPGGSAAPAADGFMAAVGIVHGDPRHAGITGLIAATARDHGAYLVGGLTSADMAFPQAAGAATIDGGVSGVLLGGRGVEVSVGLTQGCTPIGPARTVTEAQGQVLVTLDQHPAYDMLRSDVGAAPEADPRRWLANIHAAIPVPGSDRADYVVRNLAGIGPEEGLVAIAEELEEGDRVMFVRRDAEAADRDLQRMLGELKARTRRPPKAGVYYSCLARGPNLFAEPAHEMRAIADAFGPIPVVGFFGNGEIAHDRLYGYTGVLTLFG